MAKQNEEVDEQTKQETEEEIVHRNGEMGGRLAALEQNQRMLAVLADPEVAAVIKAKREGKAVKVVSDEEEPKQEEDKEPEVLAELEDSDPVKDTLRKVDRLMGERSSKLEAKLDSMLERMSAVEGIATEVRKQEVVGQVKQAKEKFKDLELYKNDMVEMSKDNPNLNVEQLYFLAKHKSGKLHQVEEKTFSEKPTNIPRRSSPSKPDSRQVDRPQGRKGFYQMLGDAMKDADFSSAE